MLMKEITRQLDELGMNNKIKGYGFSRYAVSVIIERGVMISVEEVYSFVAEKFSTAPDCVERNIRYAVEKTWEMGNLNKITDFFGYTVSQDKGKPTNSEFLFMLADRILLNLSA
ncbi:MAG: sporulation initiation factor Spo0A C-terminal domain-containing protein [Clostridia bacterium]|nr:sporulation initiation factor Spo0A C-terminal domain-containing protein [Clostridia bacterium]